MIQYHCKVCGSGSIIAGVCPSVSGSRDIGVDELTELRDGLVILDNICQINH